MSKQKIAFIYDWFDTKNGGAERVIQVFHDMYPNAPWYTSHVDYKSAQWAKGYNIRTSFIQKLPLWMRRSRILTLPLMPLAFESFDFSSFDVVVSISSAFAKNVITKANTKHLCYLLTPPRWLYKEIPNAKFLILNIFTKYIRGYLKNWDRVGAGRVDEYVSISQEVARRCKEFYGRESTVIYPPFDCEYWKNLSQSAASEISPPSTKSRSRDDEMGVTKSRSPRYFNRDRRDDEMGVTKSSSLRSYQDKQDNKLVADWDKELPTPYTLPLTPYFLVISRLKKYKRVDLAIEALARLKDQKAHMASCKADLKPAGQAPSKDSLLVIVGSGEEEDSLKKLAIKLNVFNNIVWFKSLSDEELAHLYTNAMALIMPQEEDFGYTACEALACGCPVVVYKYGGQTEIVINRVSGIHFATQNPESLAAALEEVSSFEYNLKTYENSHIRGWSRNTFVATFSQKITKTV